MGRIFKLEKYVKGTEIKFQEGVLIPLSRVYGYVFLNQYSFAILLLLGLYFLIRFKNRNKLGR